MNIDVEQKDNLVTIRLNGEVVACLGIKTMEDFYVIILKEDALLHSFAIKGIYVTFMKTEGYVP